MKIPCPEKSKGRNLLWASIKKPFLSKGTLSILDKSSIASGGTIGVDNIIRSVLKSRTFLGLVSSRTFILYFSGFGFILIIFGKFSRLYLI